MKIHSLSNLVLRVCFIFVFLAEMAPENGVGWINPVLVNYEKVQTSVDYLFASVGIIAVCTIKSHVCSYAFR